MPVSLVFNNILLPPGIIIIALAVSVILLFFKRNIAAKILLVLTVCCLYLMSIEPISDALMSPLENAYPPFSQSDTVPWDAVVVLGGGITERSPEEGFAGTLTGGSLKRTLYASRIAKSTNLPVVAAGGIVIKGKDAEPEAVVMARTLKESGLPEERLFLDTKSRNTFENAKYAKEAFAMRSVILVTSAYHMKRSMYCFEKNGIQATPAPTDYKTNRGTYSAASFLPSSSNFSISCAAFHEYVGLLYYRIRY